MYESHVRFAPALRIVRRRPQCLRDLSWCIKEAAEEDLDRDECGRARADKTADALKAFWLLQRNDRAQIRHSIASHNLRQVRQQLDALAGSEIEQNLPDARGVVVGGGDDAAAAGSASKSTRGQSFHRSEDQRRRREDTTRKP